MQTDGKHCLSTYFGSLWACAQRNQQNDLFARRRLTSAWASAQSDQSFLSAWIGSLATHKAYSEDSDQTGHLFEYLLGAQVILLVLSCGGSYFSIALWCHFKFYIIWIAGRGCSCCFLSEAAPKIDWWMKIVCPFLLTLMAPHSLYMHTYALWLQLTKFCIHALMRHGCSVLVSWFSSFPQPQHFMDTLNLRFEQGSFTVE